jgi:hypothetical protein
MKASLQLFSLILLFALGSCKKPVLEVASKTIPPLILATTISDSLPTETIATLGLENTTGLKMMYRSGLYVSYFRYHADKSTVLQTLAGLPFTPQSHIADTLCRRISPADLSRPWDDLSTEDPSMYVPDLNDHVIEIFECNKPPFRHTVITRTDSNEIFHRVERI